jgi:predicted nucleotidyltransferase
MLSEADLDRITARLAQRLAPVAVGTFGSYATGMAREESDVDLFVIRDGVGRASLRGREVRRHLPGVLARLDIHVFTPKEFEARALEHLSFEWIIVRQAKLYHWRADAPRLVPSLFNSHSDPTEDCERVPDC